MFNHLSGRYNVLICFGIYNKNNIGGLNKYLFLTVLELGMSKIKVLANSLSGESVLLGS